MKSIAKDLQVVLMHKTAVTLRGDCGTVLRAQVTPRNEYALALQCATGFETVLLVGNGGDVLMARTLFECVAETVAAMLLSEADKAAQAPQKCEAAKASAKPRCAFYREIRRCYAIAREAGLDVKADARMRAAFSRFLGRKVESREEMRAGDWLLVADAIKGRRLSW
jgi:DNA-binding Lrp family transcriptional regulator